MSSWLNEKVNNKPMEMSIDFCWKESNDFNTKSGSYYNKHHGFLLLLMHWRVPKLNAWQQIDSLHFACVLGPVACYTILKGLGIGSADRENVK